MKTHISVILYLNPFSLCHEFSFKELKLFLELYASYRTLVGNFMVNPSTCELALGIAHKYMKKFVKECGYLPSFLDTFVKNHEAFIVLNQFFLYVGDYVQIPRDEHQSLIADETWVTLLLGNFHEF
ncbi:hypothetical protein M9H77_26903 [Catharanthus roseus]|uniref:Uncharacterized protein n=1 Tax=Catharanthus roseus TaxID=4058 RepID=A0ACC0ACJ6_CATRO|nr:hypothetical protein M9H77_26903 [Catharanthus roseus]